MALTNGMNMSPTKETICPQAILHAGGHPNEVTTLGMEATVNQLL